MALFVSSDPWQSLDRGTDRGKLALRPVECELRSDGVGVPQLNHGLVATRPMARYDLLESRTGLDT